MSEGNGAPRPIPGLFGYIPDHDPPPIGGRSKYHGEQHELYGGPLQWPGIHGLPVRCAHPINVKSEELLRATLTYDFHAQTFDLSDPEQADKYHWVMDRICNGLFIKVHIERCWNKEKPGSIFVYLEWVQQYYSWPD